MGLWDLAAARVFLERQDLLKALGTGGCTVHFAVWGEMFIVGQWLQLIWAHRWPTVAAARVDTIFIMFVVQISPREGHPFMSLSKTDSCFRQAAGSARHGLAMFSTQVVLRGKFVCICAMVDLCHDLHPLPWSARHGLRLSVVQFDVAIDWFCFLRLWHIDSVLLLLCLIAVYWFACFAKTQWFKDVFYLHMCFQPFGIVARPCVVVAAVFVFAVRRLSVRVCAVRGCMLDWAGVEEAWSCHGWLRAVAGFISLQFG